MDAWRPAGTDRVLWDGTDTAGRPAASGVYLYEMRACGERVGGKVTLVR
jgi:hypothetical protein